jgi:hypothetical protein
MDNTRHLAFSIPQGSSMTPQIKKHFGKIKSTDRRCVVVFMQLPDALDKALIIDVEALPPRFEQIISEILNAPAGQNEKNLADYMNTRQVPETGRSVLNEFHANGFLRVEPINNVIMLPTPNQPIPLVDILKTMGTLPDSVEMEAVKEADKFNIIVNNLNATKNEERMQMASNMLYEAELLEAEAARKREQAYAYVPAMRPPKKGAPVADVTVATTAEEAVVEAKKSGRGGDRRSTAKQFKAAE